MAEQAEEEVNENDETASESQNARKEEETFAAWVRYLDDHNLTKADLQDLCLENCDDYERKKHKKKAQLLELAKTALPSLLIILSIMSWNLISEYILIYTNLYYTNLYYTILVCYVAML